MINILFKLKKNKKKTTRTVWHFLLLQNSFKNPNQNLLLSVQCHPEQNCGRFPFDQNCLFLRDYYMRLIIGNLLSRIFFLKIYLVRTRVDEAQWGLRSGPQ